jgi:hypothetical protein
MLSNVSLKPSAYRFDLSASRIPAEAFPRRYNAPNAIERRLYSHAADDCQRALKGCLKVFDTDAQQL